LSDAREDLSKMQSALLHVKSKASEILQSKEDIQKTINGIETELTELKGDKNSEKNSAEFLETKAKEKKKNIKRKQETEPKGNENEKAESVE